MTERCEDMARQKLKAKEKKTQKITKNGLIEKNQEIGKQRISVIKFLIFHSIKNKTNNKIYKKQKKKIRAGKQLALLPSKRNNKEKGFKSTTRE